MSRLPAFLMTLGLIACSGQQSTPRPSPSAPPGTSTDTPALQDGSPTSAAQPPSPSPSQVDISQSAAPESSTPPATTALPPTPVATPAAGSPLTAPLSLNLGRLTRSCVAQALLTVTNTSDTSVQLSDVQQAEPREQVNVVAQLPSEAIGPHQTVDIPLLIDPQREGLIDTSLSLLSAISPSPLAVIGLSGEVGSITGPQQLSFTQAAAQQADILWVVDTSASMGPIHQAIAREADIFINGLAGSGVDYHLGLITMDMNDVNHSGRLYGQFPNDLAYATPQGQESDLEAFFDLVNDLGEEGSGQEMGLAAIKAASSEPLISAENKGFYRSGSHKAFIVITDEQDQSDPVGDQAGYPADYVSYVLSLADDGSHIGAAGLINTRESEGYDELLTAMWGYIANVNLPKEQTMAPITSVAIGLQNRFPLVPLADATVPLAVTIDGTPISSGPQTWQPGPGGSDIIFVWESVPPAGAVIEISYTGAGSCGE